jgi:hypothetical protein
MIINIMTCLVGGGESFFLDDDDDDGDEVGRLDVVVVVFHDSTPFILSFLLIHTR